MASRNTWMVGLIGASMLVATSASAQTVGMATSSQGTFGYSIGAAIAKVISKKASLNMRVQPFAGSSIYIPEVAKGAVNFGVANAFEAYLAVTGDESYSGRKYNDLRIVTVVQPLKVALYVRADSDIQTLADLKGKRVPGGWTAMAILKPNMRALLANGGLSYDDVQMVPVTSIVGNAEDFTAGRTDVMAQAVGSGSLRQVAARFPVRVLPLDDSPKAIAAMRKFVPVANAVTVGPKNQPGFSGPTKVMGYSYVLITSDKADANNVYNVTKTMHDNREDLIASFRPLAGFNPKEMAQNFSELQLQYHPGAIKFYKEIGLWPPKIDGLAQQ